MTKLIRLEQRKIKLTPYLMTAVGITFLALVLGIMFALIGKLQPAAVASDSHLGTPQFMFQMTAIIQLVGFSCLGAAVAHRVIASPYSQTELLLTLTYPIQRGRLLQAKLFYVGALIGGLTIASMVVTDLIFITVNGGLHFIPGSLNTSVLTQVFLMIPINVFATLVVMTVGVASGFTHTSLPISIGVIILFDSLLGNLLTLSGMPVVVTLLTTLTVAAVVAVLCLNHFVNHLEVM